MSFSASDAAFEGFRLVRRHPLAVDFWSLAYLVFFALLFGAFGAGLAEVMAAAKAIEDSNDFTVSSFQSLAQAYGTFVWLMIPLSLVAGGILNAAVARAVLRPADSAFGYLRLGADELRVIAVSLILSLVMTAVAMVGFGVAGGLAGLAVAIGQNALYLPVVLIGLATVAVLVWLALRLSLAVPITLAEKRITPFASFALTKGKSLPLLGMGIIAFVMSLLVGLLVDIIGTPATLAVGDLDGLGALQGETTLSIIQQAWPVLVTWGVINAVMSALQLAVLYAPFSAAYRDIKGLPTD